MCLAAVRHRVNPMAFCQKNRHRWSRGCRPGV